MDMDKDLPQHKMPSIPLIADSLGNNVGYQVLTSNMKINLPPFPLGK